MLVDDDCKKASTYVRERSCYCPVHTRQRLGRIERDCSAVQEECCVGVACAQCCDVLRECERCVACWRLCHRTVHAQNAARHTANQSAYAGALVRIVPQTHLSRNARSVVAFGTSATAPFLRLVLMTMSSSNDNLNQIDSNSIL